MNSPFVCCYHYLYYKGQVYRQNLSTGFSSDESSGCQGAVVPAVYRTFCMYSSLTRLGAASLAYPAEAWPMELCQRVVLILCSLLGGQAVRCCSYRPSIRRQASFLYLAMTGGPVGGFSIKFGTAEVLQHMLRIEFYF